MLLSVCMIVKNEENVLARCLDSIKDIADEIIIIDTGSTDKTKEIASAYTEQIYDYEWTNDFAEARNAGIRRASGTWILVLDADEYFEPKDAYEFREFLAGELPREDHIYTLNIISFVGNTLSTSSMTTAQVARLFPNGFDICYTRPIHEQLHSKRGYVLSSTDTPVPVYHTGYLKEVVEAKDKRKRNADIFHSLKQKKGFNAYDLFTVGNEFAMKDDVTKAIYYYTRAIQKVDKESKGYYEKSWYRNCVVSLIQCYYKKNRLADAWNLIESKVSVWRDFPEYYCLKGVIYSRLGFNQLAKECFKEALTISERNAQSELIFWMISASYGAEIPLKNLHLLAKHENDENQEIYYLTKLLMQNTNDFSALIQLLELLATKESKDSIISLFDNLLVNNEEIRHTLLMKASISLGLSELATYYYDWLRTKKTTIRAIDLLDYYLLINDRISFHETFSTYVNENMVVNNALMQCCALAQLKWTDSSYFDELGKSNIKLEEPIYLLLQKAVVGEGIDQDENQASSLLLFKLLKICYVGGHYEIFDKLIDSYNHPELINLLANFFYSKKNYELAGNYYSILASQGQLNVLSCENLAIHHITNQLFEDAIVYIDMAIEHNSDNVQLFTLFLQHCKDKDMIQNVKSKFEHRYTQYIRLPFVKALLNQ